MERRWRRERERKRWARERQRRTERWWVKDGGEMSRGRERAMERERAWGSEREEWRERQRERGNGVITVQRYG